MATFSKPADARDWSTDPGTRVEPGAGKRALGWVSPEKPPDNFFNQLFGVTGDWLEWLNERMEDFTGDSSQFLIKSPNFTFPSGAAILLNETTGELFLSGSGDVVVQGGPLRLTAGLDIVDNNGDPMLMQLDFSAVPGGSTNATSIQGPSAGNVMMRIRNNDGNDGFAVITSSIDDPAVDAQDFLAFKATARGDALVGRDLVINNGNVNSQMDIFFGPSANNNRFSFDSGGGVKFDWYMLGGRQLGLDSTLPTVRPGGTGALEPGGDGLWDLGTTAQRWRGVNAVEGNFTGNNQFANDQVDLVSRHANNAVVMRAVWDYNASFPGVASLLGAHWNVVSVVRTAVGVYQFTLDEPIALEASILVNVPFRRAFGRMGGPTTVIVNSYDPVTDAAADLATGGANVASIAVVGSPDTYV